MLRLLFALVFVFAAAVRCGDPSDLPRDSTSAPPDGTIELPDGTIELRYEGGSLHVEIAVTPEERSRGLSNRASLPSDAGMLFVYDTPGKPSFWMKDTLVPLDMIWIDSDKRVEGITAGVQPEPGVADGALRHYSPETPVLYVLELNAGAAARIGLAPGSQLEFEAP